MSREYEVRFQTMPAGFIGTTTLEDARRLGFLQASYITPGAKWVILHRRQPIEQHGG